MNLLRRVGSYFKNDVFGIVREMRLSYLPPMMVYFAAGISGFTAIVEAFFIKESLGLSAAFLASLAFWAQLPWALKMPVGHIVDLVWKRKSLFVYLGATLMAAGLLIMIGLTGGNGWMAQTLSPELWFVIAALLAPIGFMFQDVVADAMTVEAVPRIKPDGSALTNKELQRRHVTVQTLGRISIVGGAAVVAGLAGWLANVYSYSTMHTIALVIPLISISGALLGSYLQKKRTKKASEKTKETELKQKTKPNWYILGGSTLFVLVTVVLGLSGLTFKKEMVLVISLLIIAYLISILIKDLSPAKRKEIVGIAIIVFAFRAIPTAGAGSSWWQIDVLGFDEAFFGTLRQISAVLVIAGMLVLRGWIARHSLPYLVVFLSFYGVLMLLPFIGMFYGLHEWTMENFGFGARTIAIIDTLADSPTGQLAMIPMLAWIAKEAPRHAKATYFAVMSAFANLALSASNLGTEYLNKIFVIQRGVYDELGALLITLAIIGLAIPITTVLLFNPYRKR